MDFRHGESNQAWRPDKTARQSSFVIIVSSLLVTGINSIGRSVARCISGFSTNWNNRAYLCIVVVNPLIVACQITSILMMIVDVSQKRKKKKRIPFQNVERKRESRTKLFFQDFIDLQLSKLFFSFSLSLSLSKKSKQIILNDTMMYF